MVFTALKVHFFDIVDSALNTKAASSFKTLVPSHNAACPQIFTMNQLSHAKIIL
jgi:hypothetical protein